MKVNNGFIDLWRSPVVLSRVVISGVFSVPNSANNKMLSSPSMNRLISYSCLSLGLWVFKKVNTRLIIQRIRGF